MDRQLILHFLKSNLFSKSYEFVFDFSENHINQFLLNYQFDKDLVLGFDLNPLNF